MASTLINGQLLRKDYSRIPKVVSIPNLIEVQKKSFSNFLQMDVKPEDRRDVGLQAMFKSVFPINDFSSIASLEFVKFMLLEPKYTRDVGLQAMFKSVFPINDFSSIASLEFVKFMLLEPKYTVEECHQKGMTYSAPIKLQVRAGEVNRLG
jgi:DNA-directed RNA polymerase beta subunit